MTRYAVTRANWRRLPGGVFRLPGRVDVALFDTFEAADAVRARLEARFRATVNPFDWGDELYDVSRLPIHPLTDFLLEAGLEPPGPDVKRRGWAAWWAATYRTLSPELADAAWRAFDLLSPCYAVEERPAAELYAPFVLAWAVGRRNTRQIETEGGQLRYLHRTAPDVWGGGWGVSGRRPSVAMYDVGGYEAFGTDPAEPPPEPRVVAFGERGDGIAVADMAEVPWHGPTALPKSSHVVIRLAWRAARDGHGRGWRESRHTARRPPDGLPVAAFADREAAEADAWARDVDARRYLNPFRFGPPKDISDVGEYGFRTVLAEFGLDLPAVPWEYGTETQAAWVRWWEVTAGRLSVEQRETAWDLFDRLRFHAVAELPVRG